MQCCPALQTQAIGLLSQSLLTKSGYFLKERKPNTNKEIILLSHQVNINYITVLFGSCQISIFSKFQQDVIKNKFPAERDTYIKLTGLMAQV